MAEKFNDVWDALLDDPAEREVCKIKSSLMAAIALHIKERGLTQKEAADIMGVTQPRVSNVVRAKGDKFTIDMLIDMLARLGLHVEVILKAA
ncbi:MAG: helix-turn-helix domain-containing protein [Thermodesulfobacteriota bacterium]